MTREMDTAPLVLGTRMTCAPATLSRGWCGRGRGLHVWTDLCTSNAGAAPAGDDARSCCLPCSCGSSRERGRAHARRPLTKRLPLRAESSTGNVAVPRDEQRGRVRVVCLVALACPSCAAGAGVARGRRGVSKAHARRPQKATGSASADSDVTRARARGLEGGLSRGRLEAGAWPPSSKPTRAASTGARCETPGRLSRARTPPDAQSSQACVARQARGRDVVVRVWMVWSRQQAHSRVRGQTLRPSPPLPIRLGGPRWRCVAESRVLPRPAAADAMRARRRQRPWCREMVQRLQQPMHRCKPHQQRLQQVGERRCEGWRPAALAGDGRRPAPHPSADCMPDPA